MDGEVQIIPNKFVYYPVQDGEVFLLADDVARAAGYTQRSNSNGAIGDGCTTYSITLKS